MRRIPGPARASWCASLLALAVLLAAGCSLPSPTGATGSGDDVSIPSPDALPTRSPDAATVDPDGAEPVGFGIHSVSPSEGRTSGGQLVVIEGAQFEDGLDVWFGDQRATKVTVYSGVIVHAITPPRKPGLVDVRVRQATGEEAVLVDGFLYRDPLAVTSVAPASGPAQGGTPITVRGDGFTPDTRVLIGGRLAIGIAVVDRETILAVTPPGVSGSADLIVGTAWTHAVLEDGFRFEELPRITAVEPASGPTDDTTVVTLSGSGLAPSARVWFGESEVVVLGPSGTGGLVVRVPGGPAGVVDVRLETSDGVALLEEAFAFTTQAGGTETQVVNVVPHSGSESGGTQVTVTAYGLTTTGQTQVRFGAKAAQVLSVDAVQNRAVVVAPPGSGTVDVTLETSYGTDTLAGTFHYVAAPVIAAVTPASGTAAGGEIVTVSGAGFLADTEVFLGALPATVVSATPSALTVRTPPGSPGSADVRVISGNAEALLPGGFTYLPVGGPEIYAITPIHGGIAGNTLVHVYGAGFDTAATIRFGLGTGAQPTRLSTTEFTVRSPKAEKAGTVDLTVLLGGNRELSLNDAYNYFDPTSPYGGSWGPAIRGAVNITVLDIYTTQPVPGAFVILWADGATPFRGYTDARGQIIFSADDLVGPQMITAAKADYTTMSVVEYDAENVTVHLIPFHPSVPSPGGGGGGPTYLPFGTIRGKVEGLGKYVIAPPRTCEEQAKLGLVGSEGTTNCLACTTDADCGGNGARCTFVAEEGPYCATQCLSSGDCPAGYVCGAAGGELGCVPHPGEKAAYCQTTSDTLWEPPPTPHNPSMYTWDDGSHAWADPDGTYYMKTRLGELAIICVGGVIRDPADQVGSFLPLQMGVVRHVEPISDGTLAGVNVRLDIPLEKSVPVRLDGAPLWYTDPTTGLSDPTASELKSALDFGAEGYWELPRQGGLAASTFRLERQPSGLTGDLDGVTYVFEGKVTGGGTAESGTQRDKVEVLHVDRLFAFEDGVWRAVSAGIPEDVHGLWGGAADSVWAVGADGLIAHGKGNAWLHQFSPTTRSLFAIGGAAEDAIFAVGDVGRIVRFDGLIWEIEVSPTEAPLYGVWAGSADYAVAVGERVVLVRDESGWSEMPDAPDTTLRGVVSTGAGSVWAVGDDGVVWRHDAGGWDGSWKQLPGYGLRAIAARDAGDVWIAGQRGAVQRWTPATGWVTREVPTQEDLNAIYLADDGQVFIVGDRGVLLHFDGNGWSLSQAPKYGGDLRAVWGSPEPSAAAVAAGTQVVSLGPMLSFPEIGAPSEAGGGFGWYLEWWARPGTLPTFNFVDMRPGGMTPGIWWTIVEAETTHVTFPNLPAIEGLYPLPSTPTDLVVTRVLKPGATVDNFDFWDFYSNETWTSWARDQVTFFPF